MAGRKIRNIRLSEAREEYLADMRSLGRARNTVDTAKFILEALERVIGNKVVRNIDKADINRYYTRRHEDGLQQSTMNIHTTRLRLFFDWCVAEAFIEEHVRPMRGRGYVKYHQRERARVTQDQFDVLLSSTPNPRDRIVLALGLYTLLRSSEIRTIRWADVSFEDQTINVQRWKTRERDVLPITAELHHELVAYKVWVAQFVGQEIDPNWFVAPGNKRRVARYSYETQRFEPLPLHEMVLTPDKMMFENGYSLIVKKALKEGLGWESTLQEGIHTLRRSSARELFEALREEGFDSALLTVMSWLGHKQPSTTMRYLGLEREADRRNRKFKGAVMFPKAGGTAAVRHLRAVGDEPDGSAVASS